MGIVVVCAFFLQRNSIGIQEGNVFQNLIRANHESEEKMQEKQTESLRVSTTTEQVLPCGQNIREVGRLITVKQNFGNLWDGLQVRINSIEETKLFTDTDARGAPRIEILDLAEDGTILNSFSYVVVNITVANPTEEEREIWMSSFRLTAIDEEKNDGIVIAPEDGVLSGSLVGYKTLTEEAMRNQRKDYYLAKVQAGEEVSYNLIFIIADKILEENEMYVGLNMTGVLPDYDSIYFSFE